MHHNKTMEPIKVIFVGNACSGKTFVAKKLMHEEFDNYIPTLGVEVHPYRGPNNNYNIWDCAGKEELSGLRDGYYINANIAFVFLGGETYLTQAKWVQAIRKVCNATVPIYFVSGTNEDKVEYVKNILE